MTEKLRYLVITEKFLPRKGGSNIRFDEVYRRIGDKNTHIVTADQPGAAGYDVTHPNTVHRVKLERRWWLRPESLAIYIKLLAACIALVFRYKFDAVHAGRVLSEGLVGWIVARFARVPLVIYAHGEEITTWRQPGKFRFMVFTFKHADRIIANSEFTRDQVLGLGVDAQKVVLNHSGVNLEQFQPGLETADLAESIGLGEGQKLILSVGRLSRRKGFDYVIRSLPRLLDQGLNVQYGLIGIGEDRAYLLSLAEELGVTQRVHLLGHVSETDLPRWYNLADVFIMPNREVKGDTEGFGLVYLEASACKKPVIGGTAGGTGAPIVHEQTGLRVDGASIEEITKALYRVLNNEDFARRLGEAGYRRAHKEFSWDRVAKMTDEMGKELKYGTRIHEPVRSV